MGQSEGRQPADAKALVLPRQHVVCQVDFLMDHGELQLWVLTGGHLRERDRTGRVLQVCRFYSVVK